MPELTLGRTLIYAMLAGLLAGCMVTVFHAIFSEPLIDRAIAIEAQHSRADASQAQGHDHAAPVVSRPFQKSVGLLIGYVFYGLTWALFFALLFFPLQQRLAALGAWRGPLLLAALAWWALILIPFLKYPANPPGVGDPDTIQYRQNMYLAMLLLSALGTGLALWLGSWLAPRLRQPRWLVSLACLILVGVALLALLPPNPDRVTMPAELVASFRLRSLLGLSLFWALFGLAFAALARWAARQHRSEAVLAAR